jgi:uncharacterized delta-60 repeat protein
MGKVILFVFLSLIIKINCFAQPGTLDNTFGVGGVVITPILNADDFARAVAIQPDGKIVIAGYTENVTDFDFVLARYNSDGSLDNTFGIGGQVVTDFGGGLFDVSTAIQIQPDGKIIAAGYVSTVFSYGADFAIARYNSNGTLDNTFGTGGKVITPVDTNYDYGTSVVLQSDGKIILAGYSLIGGIEVFSIVRYNNNGTLDNTFGSSGIVVTQVAAFNNRARAVKLQSDGKIIVGGDANSSFGLVRYNIDGSLDNTFGSGGIVNSSFGPSSDVAYSIAIQNDNKILLCGYHYYNTEFDFELARYNTNGTLDSTFGVGGNIVTSVGTGQEIGLSMTLQNDGKILIGGYSFNGVNNDFALLAYNDDGTLDNTFGSGGTVTTDIAGGDDLAYSIGIQSDGKIILVGSGFNGSNKDIVLARYNPTLVGVNEMVTQNDFIIYPNPASSTIAVESIKYQVQSIRIMDVLGQEIYYLQTVNNKTEIDISHLPSGIYILQVQSESGVVSKKFVKE